MQGSIISEGVKLGTPRDDVSEVNYGEEGGRRRGGGERAGVLHA